MKISHASIDPQGQNLLVHLSQPGEPDVVLNLSINGIYVEVNIANICSGIQIKIIDTDHSQACQYVPNWRRYAPRR